MRASAISHPTSTKPTTASTLQSSPTNEERKPPNQASAKPSLAQKAKHACSPSPHTQPVRRMNRAADCPRPALQPSRTPSRAPRGQDPHQSLGVPGHPRAHTARRTVGRSSYGRRSGKSPRPKARPQTRKPRHMRGFPITPRVGLEPTTLRLTDVQEGVMCGQNRLVEPFSAG